MIYQVKYQAQWGPCNYVMVTVEATSANDAYAKIQAKGIKPERVQAIFRDGKNVSREVKIAHG